MNKVEDACMISFISLTLIPQWQNRQWGNSHVVMNLVSPSFDSPLHTLVLAQAIRMLHYLIKKVEYVFYVTERSTLFYRHHEEINVVV